MEVFARRLNLLQALIVALVVLYFTLFLMIILELPGINNEFKNSTCIIWGINFQFSLFIVLLLSSFLLNCYVIYKLHGFQLSKFSNEEKEYLELLNEHVMKNEYEKATNIQKKISKIKEEQSEKLWSMIQISFSGLLGLQFCALLYFAEVIVL